MRHRRSRHGHWRWPLTLALLTGAGLLAALFHGDGLFRWLAWAALAIPVLVGACAIFRPHAGYRDGLRRNHD
jgi:hypothetical protein